MGAAKVLVNEMTEAVMVGVEMTAPGPAYRALCMGFPLVEITSKKQHKNALKVVEHLIDFLSRPDAPIIADDVSQYLVVLGDLVQKYEKEKFSSVRVSGREVLEQLMEMNGVKQTGLREELGGQSVVSLILSGERELNVRQIRALAKRFKVSPEVFL